MWVVVSPAGRGRAERGEGSTILLKGLLYHMKKIDLHLHTSASDGIFSPRGLVELAAQEGIGAMAITDHDTVSGLEEAANHAGIHGIQLIPGIEFSIDYDGGTFHLLGLYIDHANEPLRSKCGWLAMMRGTRAHKMVDDLNTHGIHIPIGDVEKLSGGGAIGRPHIARIMLKYGYGKNFNDIFKNYLVKGKPGYVRKERIDLASAISLIRDAGGIPVIAHPVTMNIDSYSEFEKQLTVYRKLGVAGIEVYSTMHDSERIKNYIRIAEKLDLIITGGSDFHGDKVEKIGYYSDDKAIPGELISAMESKIIKMK